MESRRAVDAHKWSRLGFKMEPWRVRRPLVADSHHFDEDRDPHKSEKSNWKVGSGSRSRSKRESWIRIRIKRQKLGDVKHVPYRIENWIKLKWWSRQKTQILWWDYFKTGLLPPLLIILEIRAWDARDGVILYLYACHSLQEGRSSSMWVKCRTSSIIQLWYSALPAKKTAIEK